MQILKCSAGHFFVMFAAVGLAGCGGSDRPSFDTHPVTGVVTLDEKPVAGATVTFAPVNDQQGAPATGTTDEQGRFTLTTIGGGYSGDPGAVAGEYFVGVIKTNAPPTPESHEEVGENYANQDEANMPKITHIVPEKFNNPRKSGVKVTVKEGDNDIPIPLVSK